MKSILHPSNTRVFGAPVGWDHAALPCDELAVTDAHAGGQPMIVSFWTPSKDELNMLKLGGSVALHVFGGTMVPVALTTAPPFIAPKVQR